MRSPSLLAWAAAAGAMSLAAASPDYVPVNFQRASRGKSGMAAKPKKPRKFKGSKAAKKANRR